MVAAVNRVPADSPPTGKEVPMSITLTDASNKEIPISSWSDLKNDEHTALQLGTEFGQFLDGPISAVPDDLKSGKIQYKSGNQTWNLAPACFTLSGGVAGSVAIIQSNKVLTYTDSFPTEISVGLSTATDSHSTKSVSGPEGSVYVCVELDLQITAGVKIADQVGIYGLSGSASTSDKFQVAFYKKCNPSDILRAAIGSAFAGFVLPFHANTLNSLQAGDYLRHTANANLQLGLGANIGFGKFSFADQWKTGIPGVANSPTLNTGMTPTLQPGVKLAFSFTYAGTFDQLLWLEAANQAHLHLYRSKTQNTSLDLNAGLTASANAAASTAVSKQLGSSLSKMLPNNTFGNALSAVVSGGVSEIGKWANEIDAKICGLLKPLNGLQASLDVKISSANQSFLLLDYIIDMTQPGYGVAWKAMVNGRFVDALEQAIGGVSLAIGSGLESLYSKTTAISLNFFGHWSANWSTSAIANSSLVYAGNNIFHLITVEGMQRIAKVNKSRTEIDFYFAADLDLSEAGTSTLSPNINLHVMLRAANNGGFGAYIAGIVDLLTAGQDGGILAGQVANLAKQPNATELLHLIFEPTAYENHLNASTLPLASAADEPPDQANYGAFYYACGQIMPKGSPSSFTFHNQQLGYALWRMWNLVSINNLNPPPDGALPDRISSGSGSGVTLAYLNQQYQEVDEASAAQLNTTFQAASGFMNLCADLKALASEAVSIETWNNFAANLQSIVNKDVNLDFAAPTGLALAKLCGNGMPQQTVGPVQGLTGSNSIGVTMTFS
jgi:hypothetical protein